MEETNFTMPVQPAYGSGSGFGFGGDWSWVLLLILLCGGGAWGGFGGGFGGGEFPWLLNGQNAINANTNAGFDHAATQTALGDLRTSMQSGFGDIQTALCSGFAGTNAAVNGAQNAIVQQMFANQIADMQQSFALQTQLANEGCSSRATSTANTQMILDKLCQLELDGYKRENDSLRSQLSDAKIAASQTAQNAFIAQGLSDEVDALYNRLSNCPVPTTPVYGRTPIFTCGNGGCGCGA